MLFGAHLSFVVSRFVSWGLASPAGPQHVSGTWLEWQRPLASMVFAIQQTSRVFFTGQLGSKISQGGQAQCTNILYGFFCCLLMSHWQEHKIGQVRRFLFSMWRAIERLCDCFFPLCNLLYLKPTYVRNVNEFNIFIRIALRRRVEK